MFKRLFERSADAIWLLDAQTGEFVDCNRAAMGLVGVTDCRQLAHCTPADLSPTTQPDGRPSTTALAEVLARIRAQESARFEWLLHRCDGSAVPLEVLGTRLPAGERDLAVLVARDISERKCAEQQIRELNQTLERRIAERTAELAASEARLRTLVEHAPEAIVVFDGETGRFLSGNAHACRIYGREAHELTQLTPADVSPEFQPNGRRSAELAREKMDAALRGGAPVFEWLHRHSSGRLIPTEVRLVRLPCEGRALLRASIIDNSERKRREATQQAIFQISEAVHTAGDLESLYRQIHAIVKTLMPAENFYIALLHPESGDISFPYMTDQFCARYAPLPTTKGWTGYVFRTGRTLLAGPHNAVSPDGLTVRTESGELVTGFDCGAPRPRVWLGAPLTVRGRTLGVVVVQDYEDSRAYGEEEKQILTFVAGQIALAIERKRAEQELRDSEQKFRALFEATQTGVMIHDEQRYLDANPAVVRMFGYQSAADLIGKNPVLTSPPVQPGGRPTGELAQQYIGECLDKGTARFDWVAQRADGGELPLEVILTRIEMGGRWFIQAVVTDISNRKRAEAELLRALEHEKELNRLKSSFVSMVSHEFRTPLGIIQSSAEILNDYFEQLSPDERSDLLLSITANTRRMAEMMEEVLVLSRLDAGRMEFRPCDVDLSALCRRVVDEVLSATQRRCPIRLGLGEMSGTARADERLLGHIFTNLLNNAVKYSPPGSPVEFHLRRADRDVVCEIRDRGIGIPEADQQWLFHAFQRGSNVGERPGTGLGLVIVKRCVDLHGGSIRIESRPGEGTLVRVRLPLFPSAP